jgi:hypothetical protein
VQDVYNDEAGYQRCTVSYSDLPAEEIFAAVERFYRKYYFRPKYVFKALKKMVKSAEERKRMMIEGRQFLSTLRTRKTAANGVNAGTA